MTPRLHIGAERTTIADASLALGWRSIAHDYFTRDSAILEIALAAGVPQSAETTLTLDAVEHTFTCLAAARTACPLATNSPRRC